MALKHSKFKNTGILFELLVRQITSDLLSGVKNSSAITIMERYFKPSTELGKELTLYRSFFNTFKKPLTESRALDFIGMVFEQRAQLSNRKLAEEKYELVKEIKESYDLEKFFGHRIPSYKVYASIYKSLEARSRGLTISNFEDLTEAKLTVLDHLMGEEMKPEMRQESEIMEVMREQDEGLRLLTYKILLERFNDKYKSLSSKQKTLLREYINNVSDRTALMDMVHKESKIVSENIKRLLKRVTNQVTQIKLEEVIHQLDNLSEAKLINTHHLTALMIGYEIEKQLTESFQ